MINKLRDYGVWPENKSTKEAADRTFKNIKFVVTGTLSEFTRDDIKAFIKQHGGRVVESVSANTDYLVLGENPGSKYEKAISLGVKLISESELIKMSKDTL